MTNRQVVCLGEMLIDFTPAGDSAHGLPLYEQNPGGAPANVAAAIAKQGGNSAVIACVGDDLFGRALTDALKNTGVDASGVQTSRSASTTLAFVSLDEHGDRSFCFVRKPGADMMLNREHLPLDMLSSCGIFHFGSLSLGGELSREATLIAADTAGRAGAILSYDPNWREALWQSHEAGTEAMRQGMEHAHLLKLSQEELLLLSGSADAQKGTALLFERYPKLRLVAVTLGADGCYYRAVHSAGALPGCAVNAVDTTGAGDAFWGTLLGAVARCGDVLDDEENLKDALRRANVAGAICVSGRGAIPSLPTSGQIDGMLGQYKTR